jgi:[acyl-carrier-protein] S-malonyltransferase
LVFSGEYSALCFAGAFSFADGVRLTKVRGEAMQCASDAAPSAMYAALGSNREKVQQLCEAASAQSGQRLSIGNYLCEGNYVVSGHGDACHAAKVLGRSFGTKLIPLPVSGAFHSSFMDLAVPLLQSALNNIAIQVPRIPVIANVDAQVKSTPDEIRNALLQQVVSPVQWEDTMNKVLHSKDFQKCYEIGPGTVCRGIVKKIRKDATVINII